MNSALQNLSSTSQNTLSEAKLVVQHPHFCYHECMEGIENGAVTAAPDDVAQHVAGASEQTGGLVQAAGEQVHAQEVAAAFQNTTQGDHIQTAAEATPAQAVVNGPNAILFKTREEVIKEEKSHTTLRGIIGAAFYGLLGFDARPGEAHKAIHWNHLEDTKIETKELNSISKG